jgi:hypothetical protein
MHDATINERQKKDDGNEWGEEERVASFDCWYYIAHILPTNALTTSKKGGNHGIYLVCASCDNQTRQETKWKNEWGEEKKVCYFLLIYTINEICYTMAFGGDYSGLYVFPLFCSPST